MSLTAEPMINEEEVVEPKDRDVELVDDFEDESGNVQLSLEDLTGMMLSHPSVKQAMVILISDDHDVVEFKGHFYDNAALLSGIMKDYKAKIYSEIFSDRED
tara:strand:- start:28386 stop:28691 length:306 start_codon:yes stop_codon:yes gene_type:complete